MAKELMRAEITDAESLYEIGAHEAYRRMLAIGKKPHFISYYVLHMGLQGRPWNDCTGTEKDQLRKEFDTLLAGPDALPADLSRFLREIGLFNAP